jgi:hypothetical protein
MREIAQLTFLFFALTCLGHAQAGDAAQPSKITSNGSDTEVVPLVRPYAISTAPHFAVLVQFPKADSIRRIALGDSNYFLAEADKDDPHYAIVKQIKESGEKAKSAIETNMLVYMASGRVVNIMLKAGKLAETAYSIDYPIADAPIQHDPAPPQVDPEVIERAKRDEARKDLTEKMIDEVKVSPKKQAGIVAGGLTLRPYRTERLDELALVSFDIENTSAAVVDLEDPQIKLVTAADKGDKGKDRKKGVPAKVEPVQLAESVVSLKQLPPGARAVCLVAFKPPVHDSDQHVLLSVSNRAMADQPAVFRIE